METNDELHPVRDDGTEVDATFELAETTVFEMVFRHKAGARGSARAINSDYHEGLELVLARLSQLRTTILEISVDSAVARDLPVEDRVLDLDYPIDLDEGTDAHEIRRAITRAQKPIARRADAKPGGGNDQKTIRLTFVVDSIRGVDGLAHVLIGGASEPPVPAETRAAPANKHTLRTWVLEALEAYGGRADVVEVSRHVWTHHASDLEGSDDLLYTWQYDLRWAAYDLRQVGLLRSASESPRGVWEVSRQS
jgi:hypothetical protein